MDKVVRVDASDWAKLEQILKRKLGNDVARILSEKAKLHLIVGLVERGEKP